MRALFEVKKIQGTPACVRATDARIIDQFEWLQLTIGRFLAPARRENGDRSASYLLHGREPDTARPEDRVILRQAIDAEVTALVAVVGDLYDVLEKGSENGRLDAKKLLLSVQTLVDLRIPKPTTKNVCLCEGALQLIGWGLDEGVRLFDLDQDYYEQLNSTLCRKYGVETDSLGSGYEAHGEGSSRAEFVRLHQPSPDSAVKRESRSGVKRRSKSKRVANPTPPKLPAQAAPAGRESRDPDQLSEQFAGLHGPPVESGRRRRWKPWLLGGLGAVALLALVAGTAGLSWHLSRRIQFIDDSERWTLELGSGDEDRARPVLMRSIRKPRGLGGPKGTSLEYFLAVARSDDEQDIEDRAVLRYVWTGNEVAPSLLTDVRDAVRIDGRPRRGRASP